MTSPKSHMPRISIGSSVASSESAAVDSGPVTSSTPSPARSDSPSSSSPQSNKRKRKNDHLDEEASDEYSCSPPPTETQSARPFPCLCTPEPKIPRPRNAFILYRQHHYPAVVAKHPGINNPDISKILGETWRKEPEEEKQKWKALSEEDKLQHQQRHPLYRYQPKRNRKAAQGNDNLSGSWGEAQTCPRCSRISVLQQPATHDTMGRSREEAQAGAQTSVGARRSETITLPPPKPSSAITPSTSYLPMHNLSLHSPASFKYQDKQHALYSGPAATSHHATAVLSPKRRRLDIQQLHTAPVRHGQVFADGFTHSPVVGVGPRTPSLLSQGHIRRVSLPPAAELMSRGSNRMGPPPNGPEVDYSQHRTAMRRPPGGRDPSLTLPPLQAVSGDWRSGSMSAIPYPPPSVSDATVSRDTDARKPRTPSPTEVLLDKLSVLKKILSPAPATAERHPGASIIAIDGDDLEAIQELSLWLLDSLKKLPDTEVSVVYGTDMAERNQLNMKFLFDCMDCAKYWHSKSRDIVDHVTKRPADSTHTRKSSSGSVTMSSSPPALEHKSSVMVLSSSSFTAINKYASWIPPTNEHNGKMHWEWTAGMWRGVVAPDLLIYVMSLRPGDASDRAGVHVLDSGKVMIIKRCKEGADTGAEAEVGVRGVQSADLRRLGFEVGEWLREHSATR